MTCKLYFGMGQTLVLNASYEPLNITSWRRAVILMIKGKAESLEEDQTLAIHSCLLYTSPSPRDRSVSRMPSSA